ncbi:MAG: peptidoglycan editing factor PgeF [Clostridiales bacterium]|nr:peptidoglycan editing factor PgeF [Clostridiales bacterium]
MDYDNKQTRYNFVSDGDLKYLRFGCFENHDNDLIHLFSTRLGGVSKGDFESLNLSVKDKDEPAAIKENYRRLFSSAGLEKGLLVNSNQVHGDKLKTITCNDVKELSGTLALDGYDGLLTNVSGVTLETFHADCTPVFFYDPILKVIGLAHSGWKGTYLEIAGSMVQRMRSDFQSNPEDIIAAIGPAIGKCCFEVGDDVYDQFHIKFPDEDLFGTSITGKRTVDLKKIIRSTLERAGLKPENINDSCICTKCCRDTFYSYRGDGPDTGSLAAFMHLKTTDANITSK